MTKLFQRVGGTAALASWWAFIALRMVADARRDRGPTGLPNDLPNWHNRPGDLGAYLTLSAAEMLVVLVILRPYSYSCSWRRPLAALALLTPWTLGWGLLMIHSGGIMVLHFGWLIGLGFGLAVLAGMSGLAALVARPTELYDGSRLTG